MKTIGIVVTEGSLVRNILRAGGFALMTAEPWRIVVFLHCREVPPYFAEEFRHENVEIIPVRGAFPGTRLHRLFKKFTHYLFINKTTRRYFLYSQHFLDKPRAVAFLHRALLEVLGRLPFLRKLVRPVERLFFPEIHPEIEKLLDRHRPDLIFSTSLTATLDAIFLKAARRRGIRTVSMPKSWDNLTKMYLRVVPDYPLVQNEELKEKAVSMQGIPAGRVFVVGFPQFDWYAKKDLLGSRAERLVALGLDPSRATIFFGSQGKWYPDDWRIAELLAGWVERGELVRPAQLIVRPYFFSAKEGPFGRFRGRPHVVLDERFRLSGAFIDRWDPSAEDSLSFARNLAASDVVVMVLSTLALDAAALDRPVVNAVFGSLFRKGKDITPRMTSTEHFGWVFETGGVALAQNPGELKAAVDAYLKDPERDAPGRRRLRERLCFRVDGRSSERMVAALRRIMTETP